MTRLLNPLDWLGGRTLRIGVTGLARAGKTAFLTSVAANLLAAGAGRTTLPALTRRLDGRRLRVALAPAGAGSLPRFDVARHLASLAADPPRWPERTNAVSLLALDLELDREAFGLPLPQTSLRLELLDYPGEWLLDLPLLSQSYAAWSDAALRRLEQPAAAPYAGEFLAFAAALPHGAGRDEHLAATGHRLYGALLHRLRDEAGLSLLQPGRFLMPSPGAAPPWLAFFPARGAGGLAALLAERYDAYVGAVRDDLVSPLFGNLDCLVVLADLLSPLHAGPAAFADARAALAAASGALRWRRSWVETLLALGQFRLPPRSIARVAYAATKSDHVADRQRGNLAALLRALTTAEDALGNMTGDVPAAHLAVAAVRCTEDFVWTLDDRPVSAVRGREIGADRLTRSYPGEVPDRPPDAAFWAYPFLALPEFEPRRPPDGGRGGVPQLGLDALLAFLLEDVL